MISLRRARPGSCWISDGPLVTPCRRPVARGCLTCAPHERDKQVRSLFRHASGKRVLAALPLTAWELREIAIEAALATGHGAIAEAHVIPPPFDANGRRFDRDAEARSHGQAIRFGCYVAPIGGGKARAGYFEGENPREIVDVTPIGSVP